MAGPIAVTVIDRGQSMSAAPSPRSLHRNAHTLLFHIRTEADRAMLLTSIWWRANKPDVTGAMNGTSEAIAFGGIRDAVHMAIVQGLMRIHDRDRRAIGLGHIFADLDDPRVPIWIKKQRWSRNIDVNTEIDAARAIFLSTDHQRQLTALKVLRDQHISHHDLSPVNHGAKYGFERDLLASTLKIIEHLDLAVNGASNEFDTITSDHDRCSDDFWTRAINGKSLSHDDDVG
jgi:hypothetical protein